MKKRWIIAIVLLLVATTLYLSFPAQQRAILPERSSYVFDPFPPFSFQEPAQITEENALLSLISSQAIFDEMNALNFSTFYVRDRLLEAQRYFIGPTPASLDQLLNIYTQEPQKSYLEILQAVAQETPSYEIKVKDLRKVHELSQLISYRKEYASKLLDVLFLLDDQESIYAQAGVNTSSARQLIDNAQVSFDEERFEESEAFLIDASSLLEDARREYTRFAEIQRISTNFLLAHWRAVILVLMLLAVLGAVMVVVAHRHLIQTRLDHAKEERSALTELMKKAQRDYLERKTISAETYQEKMQQYQDRQAELSHEIPALMARLRKKK